MTLFDCCIQYFFIPATCLELKSKPSLLAALNIYRHKEISLLDSLQFIPNTSRHQRRKASETARDLMQKDVIALASPNSKRKSSVHGYTLLNVFEVEDRHSEGRWRENKWLPPERIALPYKFDYALLSRNALRVLIQLHKDNRNSRDSFQMTVKQGELARKLGTARTRISEAFKQLVRHRLLSVQKDLNKEGMRVVLCDPESGSELHHLALYQIQRLERIPVHDRYKMLLENRDPKHHLKTQRTGVLNYSVVCPFPRCGDLKEAPTFKFSSTEETDWWKCYKCGRKGNSKQLYFKVLSFRQREEDWRTALTTAAIPEAKSQQAANEPETPSWNF